MKQQIDHKGALLLAQFFKLHEQLPEKRLFTFQQEKEPPDSVTVTALVNKTKILGNMLQRELAPQEKALLLFPQGLAYIYSLLACLYANVIAIPIPLTDVGEQEQVLAKISAILIDSQAACIITDTKLKEFLITQQVVTQIPILNIDELPPDDSNSREARPQAPSDSALLLYTSGSTSQPKGVMLSHSNLLSQAFMGATQWGMNQESCIVSWMPQFHNFGLYFNLLSPLLTGASSVILPPSGVIKNPEAWLKTIDKYQATHTAAPNFAFDYCCSSIDIASLKECSLHSLQAIICGGEPVRKETYENFTRKFHDLGLGKNVFCTHYGLSETGSVTTSKPSQPLRFLSLDISLLGERKIKHTNQKKKSKSVASCGEIGETIQILSVHPETCVPCAPGEIGEIWIKSPSVAMGYLNRQEETESTFSGVLSNTNEGEFLRTGDLGFVENNQLYIVGREKELIIIHGKNHHPIDIEWTIKKNIPDLTLPMAVFSCEISQQEKVVVVQEVETSANETEYKKLIGAILAAVSRTHEIEVYEIIFVKRGIIPKTGSGKVQRKLCRNSYINQELPVLYTYQQGAAGVQSKVQALPPQLHHEIVETLKKQVFLPVLNTDLTRLEEVAIFSELGLNSIQYVQISKGIETVFAIEFAPVMLFKHPGFTELAEYLSTQIEGWQSQVIDPVKHQADMCTNSSNAREESIAIIGIQYNFPGGAPDLECFWENLVQQKDCITPISESRAQIIAECQNYDGGLHDSFPPWGGFIEDVDSFDAPFFGISPLEAESMDPQQRKVLELIWGVIENSGYNPHQLAGKDIGLFVGVHNNDYAELVSRQPSLIDTYGAYLDSGLHMSLIAHRISRWFNFHGPSEVVNTACSSSLVAIHHAVESIYRGESSMAIAGGINLILAPRTYRASHKAGMLSKNGRCKTFDEQADGFVRAEGYGAVLLKPYGQAIEDKDTIYGIIKGSVINHDGHSNSLRAPNLNAQKELIKAAYQKSGLPVDTISYIETHGTGTPLGDPIEIQALQEAFQEINPDLPHAFCGLGTVKTNIGHCESAAGIAGLIKVLFSMKYGTLPGILHFKKLNPYISLQNSPFFVVEQTQAWKRLKDSEGYDIPRRAGISSFGFGGANAHVVIEEHISTSSMQQVSLLTDNTNPVIIPISAKTQACLRTYAQQLHTFLSKSTVAEQNLHPKFKNIDLLDLAYTLQIGRAAMEERIVFLAHGILELMQKLEAFIQNKGEIDDCWQGHVKQGKNTVALLGSDEDSQELVHKWIMKSKLDKVVQYWVQGGTIDWNLLYDQVKPRRMNLPSYPFAKMRYWIPAQANNSVKLGLIHPLLHRNTSDLLEQRFSSTFTGQDFFLADHIVKDQRVLPGVVCLEMARAAVKQATGALEESQNGICLKNVVWIRPIAIGDQEIEVHIGLYPEDNGEVAYEIYSEPKGGEAEPIVYSQGRAVLSSVAEVLPLNLQTLQLQCMQSSFSSTQCYEAFRAMGLDYGPAYQGIAQIYVGPGHVLAKLSLPSSVSDTQDQFVLHPSLMDASLQASIGLMMGACGPILSGTASLNQALPLALEELEVLGKCASTMWALVRSCDGSKAGDKVQKLDIDLCDEHGRLCVRMKGLEMQQNTELVLAASLETKQPSAPISQTQEPFELMTFEEIWQEQALTDSSPVGMKTIVCFLSNPKNQQAIVEAVRILDPQTNVIFISQNTTYQKQSPQEYSVVKNRRNNYEDALQSIRKDHGELNAMLYLWALEDPGCIQDYANIVYILQAIASSKLKPKRFLLAAQFENVLERCYLEAWIGFERSLGLVLPNTQVAFICQEIGKQRQEHAMQDWLQKIWAELETHKAQSVLYQEGKRHICQIRPISIQAGKSPVRSEGTYLITGGCGGLGYLFAQHLAKMQPVNLILTGRSAIDEEKQSKITTLEDLGSQVLYIQADICDEIRMKEELKRSQEHFGRIHGVIHAAGMESKQSILEKEIQSFTNVLAPKIKGTLVLDDLLQEEPLDFICYFSSTSAILGDFGSCDYAIGNRFLMAYAHYRNHQQRQGKAMVINWPLWKDGGMRFKDDEATQMYLKSSGQRSLEVEEGMAVFDRILSQGNTQSLVLVGQRSRVYRFLGLVTDQAAPLRPFTSGVTGKGRRVEMKGFSLQECLEWDLKEHISKLLKISRDKLDTEENLADFGFDSISLAEFATVLATHYGIEITPALFFQHSTLEKLTQYFLTGHQEAIREFYREEVVEQAISPSVPSATVTPRPGSRKPRFRLINTSQSIPESIAIIGMSGRFPDARNIDEMWAILTQGRDVVREIPADRFPGRDPKWKCGLLPGVSEFDPLFFEISPKEAETMDPKQRLLLQETWNALEDAGYGATKIKVNRIGMFVGVEDGDYRLLVKDKDTISSNHNAILAARLSYFLNLSGPNMAINTACSSSLVAAHQACWSLRNHECDTAIAAGVNVLSSEMFKLLSQAGMLSDDGRCFTFDKRANGMVPGEAVVSVVLKRLSQAKADGDQIYAVIKGSGINYDGKTNGITAPSGNSQTGLLKAVYEQYQVNPEEIEYIVTHGTGTKLGDPIEINALYNAFKEYTKKQGYCALTSTKTNFGHTFAAAGLVSLISLVQALRYETIPASLHCEQENDYINWKESPFYVNKANQLWPQAGGKGRTGAVSAFGMSGTNAHMVVQSYADEEAQVEQAPCFLLALSAKTQEALQEKIKDMIIVLQKKDLQAKDLLQISYTLLEGRQHFNHRAAIVVQDREDAVYVWQQAGGKERLPNLFQGEVPRDFKGQKAIQEYAQVLLKRSWSLKENKHKYQEILYALADLYCQGYDLPWNQLYGDTKPCCVSLPTYPFARESYWVPKIDTQHGGSSTATLVIAASIHPLLHQNTSDLSEQRFTSTFSGREFFLADHVVKGQPVLPGVAYLEMARAAVEQATGVLEEDQTGIRLENVVWVRPIVMGEQPVSVHIGLFPEESGEIAFEIYSQSGEAGAEPVVHSQGIAALSSPATALAFDLPALQAQCNQSSLSSGQCYEAFRAMGLDYGPAYQGIERIYVGSGQVLAKLSLPFSVSDTQNQFALHPSMMDAALQASIGLLMSSADMMPSVTPHKPILPFALQEVEVFGNCTSVMWALIRYGDGGKAGDKVQKLDIDLYDDQGNVRVRMKGLSSRVLEGEVSSVRSSATLGTLMLHPCWKEQAIAQETIAPDYVGHVVILCEPNKISQEIIESQIHGVRCLTLQSKQEGIEERFQAYATQVFEEIQNILKAKPAGKLLVQIIVPNWEEQRLFTGLSGFMKTAQLENPKLIGQLIEIEPGEDAEGIIEKLQENSRSIINNHVRYQDGKRYVAGLSEVEASPEEVKIPWKDQGVYLITGGVGGLGLIFAKEIAHKVKDAALVLTGRSPLNEKKQAELKELQELGARIEYRQVDVTQEQAVVNLIQSIQAGFGGINGIIHSAGVIWDNFIIKKNKEELQAVLAPKVAGLVYLDQASKELPLDFFMLFSSGAGVVGNAGQADYATANAFMDAYAAYRNALVASNQRHGQTLSIIWPLWQEGGMRIDEESEKLMRQNTGMIAMQTSTGIRALYQSMAFDKDQVMVLEGNVVQLRRWVEFNATPGKITNSQEKISVFDDSLKVQTLNFVKQILANEIKLSPDRIQNEISFEKYGVDSIVQMNLIREMEKVTGQLSKTLLFEYSNIQELVEYLVKNHADRLLESIALESDNVLKQEEAILPRLPENVPSSFQKKHRFARFAKTEQTLTKQEMEDIAIIGISGRYPLSNTLEELWEHLKAGDNCITEAPQDRWNISLTKALVPDQAQHRYQRYYGGFLDHINRFDHHLFEFAQAQVMELPPELRLFLEIVWETFEDAGYTKMLLQEMQTSYLSGVGVFVGTMYSQYAWTIPSLEQAVLSSNATDWQIANRTSHFFNLTGPSIAVNSACSSSLTAIHLACESLKQRSCSMAIAGGVNLTLDPSKYKGLQRIKFLGSGDQSKSFGIGDGYIPGEGVGAVLLKPLSLAIKDGDRVHAVIKSSLVNHSGGRQVYTAPEPKQQAQLIIESIRRSGIDPLTIGYVESAANGSDLGDPIEMIALHNAFKQYTEKRQFCALGSVKSNLGHLEAASGISQLSKVILQLKHKTLVPTINASPQNSNIKLEHTAFYLQEETRPWNQPIDPQTGKNLPRRSMINSFGAGGAYANLIIEEFMKDASIKGPSISFSQEHLIIFSAKTAWSLMRYIEKMQGSLRKNSSVEIAAVARSLQKVNHNLEHRAAIIASSVEDLCEKLDLLQTSGEGLTDLNIYISSGTELEVDATKSLIIQQALEKKDVRQLAQLWVAGAAIDFRQLNKNPGTSGIDLPKYAFEHHVTFDFTNNYMINNENEAVKFDDAFYRILLEKIAKGELSEDEFKDAMM